MRTIFLITLLLATVSSQVVRKTFNDGIGSMRVLAIKSGVFTIERDPSVSDLDSAANLLVTRCFPVGYKTGDVYPRIVGQKVYSTDSPSKFAVHCKVGDTLQIETVANVVDVLPKNTTFIIEEIDSSAISTVQYGAYTGSGQVVRVNSIRSDGFRVIVGMVLPSGVVSTEFNLDSFLSGIYPPEIDQYTVFYVPSNTPVEFKVLPQGYKIVKLGDSVTAVSGDLLFADLDKATSGTCAVFKDATSSKSLKYACSTLSQGLPSSPFYQTEANGSISVQSVPALRLSSNMNVTRGDNDVESVDYAFIAKDEDAVLVYYSVNDVLQGSYFVSSQDSPQFLLNYPPGQVKISTKSAALYKVELSGADVYREYAEFKPIGGYVWVQLTSQQSTFISFNSNSSFNVFSEQNSVPVQLPELQIYSITVETPLYVRFDATFKVNAFFSIAYNQDFLDVDLTSVNSRVISLNNTEKPSIVRFRASDRCFDLITESAAPVSNELFSVIKSYLSPNTYTICKTNASDSQNTFSYIASSSYVGDITASRVKIQNLGCGQTVFFDNNASPIIFSLPDAYYSYTTIPNSIANFDWSYPKTTADRTQIVATLSEVRVQPLLRFLQNGGRFTMPSTCKTANQEPNCASNSQCPSGLCLSTGECVPNQLNPQTSQIRVSSSVRIASSLFLVLIAIALIS